MFPLHDGSPPRPDAVFPVPPSPAIGRVRSAFTNAKATDSGVSRFFRGLGDGTICTYVGEAGVQQYTKGAFGAPVEALVRFDDVDRACAERARVMQGTSVVKNAFKLHFRPQGGDTPLFTIDGDHYTSPPPPDSGFHFATAAESAWDAYKIPRVLADFARTGVAEFRSTSTFVVRVTADELSAGSPAHVMRTRPRRELKALWIENGRVYADPPLGNHAEVAGTGLGNYAAFLALLKQLGYPLR